MLTLQSGSASRNCQGFTRRAALKAGFLGLAGLGLPDYLRARQEQHSASDRAVILIWLDGGPSQLETYDPKPDAPAEYRGPFGVCKTAIPGVCVSALMPETAKRIDKVSLVRSLHHDNGDHFAAAHWMTTGRFGSTSVSQAQKFPSVGSYVARVRGPINPRLPAYVGLPSAETVYLFPGYMGAGYLGGAYNPFDVDRERKYLGATDHTRVRSPKWLASLGAVASADAGRLPLLKQLDTARRDVDASGVMATMDQYQQQALDFVLSSDVRVAFDLDREDPRAADRYGLTPWGRYTLMARRLVEAGVTFVTVDMPHWDDHSSIEKGHGTKVPVVDRAVVGADRRPVRARHVGPGDGSGDGRVRADAADQHGPAGHPGAGPRPLGQRDLGDGRRRRADAGRRGRPHQREGRAPGGPGNEARGAGGDDLPPARHRPEPDVQGPHRPAGAHLRRPDADPRTGVTSHSPRLAGGASHR